MRRLAFVLIALSAVAPACAGDAPADGIVIDVPVRLTSAKVVFNVDRRDFAGDEPVEFDFLRVMTADFAAVGTRPEIVAIFHGAAGYILLDDAKYNAVRNWTGGNPYKSQVLAAMASGVSIEECAQTMRDLGWTNADLIPGIKVNTGANLRIIELVQEGYVQIQP